MGEQPPSETLPPAIKKVRLVTAHSIDQRKTIASRKGIAPSLDVVMNSQFAWNNSPKLQPLAALMMCPTQPSFHSISQFRLTDGSESSTPENKSILFFCEICGRTTKKTAGLIFETAVFKIREKMGKEGLEPRHPLCKKWRSNN